LAWERSAATIGLQAEVHRSAQRQFTPNEKTLLARTESFEFTDAQAPQGRQYYALVLTSGAQRNQPAYARVAVPSPAPPPAPVEVRADAASCSIKLQWKAPTDRKLAYHVYRVGPDGKELQKLTEKPVRLTRFTDVGIESTAPRTYVVRAVSPRGVEGKPAAPVTAAALLIKAPVFTALAASGGKGFFYSGEVLAGRLHGKAVSVDGMFEFKDGGHATFPHRKEFELGQPLSVECWVWLDQPGKSPVLASCGEWRQNGWFLQRLGGVWRWHLGGLDCDGGKTTTNQWVHLAATFDGKTARLYENGVQVSEVKGDVRTGVWPGELHIGQYSASPGPDFQVTGRMTEVKIYHRPLTPAEIAEAAKAKQADARVAAK
jgi:hypothetical protein